MPRLLNLTVLCSLLTAGPAMAEVRLFSPDTVQAVADLRLGASDGLRSWTEGGFGKTRFGGASSGVAARAMVGAVDVVWKPELTDDVSLVVDAIAQPHASRGVDISESYLLYRPAPSSDLRVQARAGLLYVPISLEHDSAPGEPWTVVDTITPSAINSWVG